MNTRKYITNTLRGERSRRVRPIPKRDGPALYAVRGGCTGFCSPIWGVLLSNTCIRLYRTCIRLYPTCIRHVFDVSARIRAEYGTNTSDTSCIRQRTGIRFEYKSNTSRIHVEYIPEYTHPNTSLIQVWYESDTILIRVVIVGVNGAVNGGVNWGVNWGINRSVNEGMKWMEMWMNGMC